MMTPAWILDIFAALMLVVAAVSAARLVAARPWQADSVVVDTDVAHLLMAIAMAGMLASSLTTLPGTAWEVVFGLLTAWFAYRVVRDARANGVRALAGGHCAPHLVHSAAMLYMFLALAAPAAGGGSGMGGMGGSSGSAMQTLRYPTLAFVFALILVGYSIWDLDQLSGKRYSTTRARVSPVRVALAGVPALAGAESATATFSGPEATGSSAATATLAGSAAADGADEAVPGGESGGGSAASGFLLSPATTVGCRIAMGVAMAFMLLIMI
jgi:Domain of unknown function (DUF5134)